MVRIIFALPGRARAVVVTLASTLAAFGATLLLDLRGSRPFLFPMLAVVISAIHGGFWAGVGSGALTILLVEYAFLPPTGRITMPPASDVLQFAMFGTVALAISFLTNRRRQAEDRLRKQAQVLESMIRERDTLLQREHAARAEAEQASRLKDEFLATLSHELRTPLNAVLGWSHILTSRDLEGPQQRHAIEVIHRNSLAQSRLVDDVLDLSRVVAGRMPVAKACVDLADVVRLAVDSHGPVAAEKRQTIRLDASEPAWVMGDAGRLRQVTWNLLSNATKFTGDGGTIDVSVRAVDGRAVLTVRDTGSGIDPAFLPYVFDAFRQQDGSTTRLHGGLGIGLALVRHLVKAHDGAVEARSDGDGTGTTIEVRIPLAGAACDRSA